MMVQYLLNENPSENPSSLKCQISSNILKSRARFFTTFPSEQYSTIYNEGKIMPNWVQSDCIMVQFVYDIFLQLYAITSDLIFQLYKGVTPVNFQKKFYDKSQMCYN